MATTMAQAATLPMRSLIESMTRDSPRSAVTCLPLRTCWLKSCGLAIELEAALLVPF
jgi:hypothetical protein